MLFSLEQYRDNIAFLSAEGCVLYYKDLIELSEILLEKIGSGNLVLLLASNVPGIMASYVSLLNAGNVIIMVSEAFDISIIKNYIRIYRPDYIYCTERKALQLGEKREVLCKYGCSLVKNKDAIRKEIYHETVLLLPTSGSTGNNKFVRLSKENILDNTKAIIKFLNIKSTDRPIISLPIYYTYGLSVLNTHIYAGATILVPNVPIFQKKFWEFFLNKRGTSFSGVPYSYEILDRMGICRQSLPSLEYFTQSGGRMRNDLKIKLLNYVKDNGKRIYFMYGQTEATARMSYLPYEVAKNQKKIESVGIPISGSIMRLYSDAGLEITDPYQQGEIYFYGKSVSLGYAKDYLDLARKNDNKYCLKTGDIAYKDEDGFYYICGRKRRFVKILGIRVNLDDLEKWIYQEYNNIGCAVTGDDHKILIWIEGDKSNRIRDFIAEKLKIDRSLIEEKYLKKLPRTESGKILYAELKENEMQ